MRFYGGTNQNDQSTKGTQIAKNVKKSEKQIPRGYAITTKTLHPPMKNSPLIDNCLAPFSALINTIGNDKKAHGFFLLPTTDTIPIKLSEKV